jgi:ligand-binding SRPBCC domain-containing protein
MIYRHAFVVRAALERVRTFHARPESLGAITPPPIRMQLLEAPVSLERGGEIRFTLWLGPLPVRWTARIQNVSADGFEDVQVSGPFRHWTHSHRFAERSPGQTEVRDVVKLSLRPHFWWGSLGLGMALGLPLLFAYRARRTRRLLEGG